MGAVTFDQVGERTPFQKVLGRVLPVVGFLPVVGYVVLIIAALTQIVPFVLTVANSFKCLPAVNAAPAAFLPLPPFGVACKTPEGETLSADATSSGLAFNPAVEGYQQVFQQNLGLWLVNSTIFSVVVMLLRLVLDSLAGYALARIKFPGSRLLFIGMLGTMMIPVGDHDDPRHRAAHPALHHTAPTGYGEQLQWNNHPVDGGCVWHLPDEAILRDHT